MRLFLLVIYCSYSTLLVAARIDIPLHEATVDSQHLEMNKDFSFREKWGLSPIMNEESVALRQQSSKVLGWVYLVSRTMEYNFKAPVTFVANRNFSDHLLLVGLCIGNLGNLFQGYQGAFDWRTYQYQDEALISFFAIIAILRGVGNMVADTTAVANIYSPSHSVVYVSNIVGISTDVLGFIKNVKDVFKNKNTRKLAYILCTLSRFPFVASNILSLHPDLLENKEDSSYRKAQNILSLTAMALFNTGAFIRLSLDLKAFYCSSRIESEPSLNSPSVSVEYMGLSTSRRIF